MMKTPAWWSSKNGWSTALLPLSLLYRVGYAVDAALARPQRAALPVIAIGNLTAGGAGKTPTAIALAQLLQTMGEVPHIISRGYGGTPQHAHRVDPAHDDAARVGDEALLLAAHAPTWVGADRLASIRAAQQAGASVILADDAMQHHALAKDISFLVVDAAYGLGNGRLLPAGPLRAPVASVAAGTQLLLIGPGDAPAPLAALRRWHGTIAPVGELGFLKQQRWLAFAGIAHPAKFYATLRSAGATVVQTQDFPDHHPFSAEALDTLQKRAAEQGLALITTEKDAMRLPPSLRPAIATLPVALQLADAPALAQFLAEALARARA